MTVKSYLHNSRKLNLEIRAKKRQREGLYLLVTGTAIRYDLDRVQTSPTGDKIDRILSDVADLDRVITQSIEKLARMQKRSMEMIETLDKPEYKAVLTDYYINCYSWEKVADMNNYSVRHAKRIGVEAVDILEKRYFINSEQYTS